MSSIKIVSNPPPVNPQTPASFSPQNFQTIVTDTISWNNTDQATKEGHWPAPVNNGQIDKTGWLSQAIPPNASSKESVTLSAGGTYNYCCALHPQETGVIVAADDVVTIVPNSKPTANAPGSFSPGTLNASQGDVVLWANSDSNAHQPMPATGTATDWFSAPIQPGQGGSSDKPASGTGNVKYGCALHSGEEGVIKVS